MQSIGVVVIGRNEGERLVRSLDSVVKRSQVVVYVDSGSNDGSCEVARQRGITVIELDMLVPFTAARARNAGFNWLRENYPQIQYIQFIDGDCEVVEDWLEVGGKTLDSNPDVVAVCGWTCERYPERSIYNRICSVEWRMESIGPTLKFGGIVMIQAQSLEAVGGYNESVIAAEDDELSIRLRQAGGKLLRIDHDSVLHDVDMHHFSQWWQRAKRCGYAFAQVSHLHGATPERKFVKEVWRTWLWGGIMPLVAMVLTFPTHGLSLIIFSYYPLTTLRVIYKTRRQGFSWADSLVWGLSCGLSVFPGVMGVVKFHLNRFYKQRHEIIEHKISQSSVIEAIQSTGRQANDY